MAEVSKIGNLYERLVVVNRGWQSEATDGPTGGWGLLSFSLSFSLSLTIYLPTYLPVCLSVYFFIYLFTYLSIHPSIYLSISLSLYLSVCLSIDLSIYRSIYLSISLSLCLSVYLSVYLQVWKRSYSARLPQFLNLTTSKTQQFSETSSMLNVTTSKTKQFCETSSFFEVDNIKNERILRDFLQKWKVECRADGLVPMRFAIFPVHLSKVLRLPRKSDARSCEVLHLSRKIISANLKIWGSKMQPLSGNQRPDLPALMKMSLVLRLPRKMHLCRSSSNVPRLPSLLDMLQNPRVLLTFDKVHNPLRLPRGTTSERPKVVRTPGVFDILTSKCASRHNGVHFFDIATSKSAPKLRRFVHFDFEMCFAPQWHALFRHLNFQKWSGPGVFYTCWFRNVLRATTACTFSTSQLLKVLRSWCVLYILTSKCASRHNGAHFFDISTSRF